MNVLIDLVNDPCQFFSNFFLSITVDGFTDICLRIYAALPSLDGMEYLPSQRPSLRFLMEPLPFSFLVLFRIDIISFLLGWRTRFTSTGHVLMYIVEDMILTIRLVNDSSTSHCILLTSSFPILSFNLSSNYSGTTVPGHRRRYPR